MATRRKTGAAPARPIEPPTAVPSGPELSVADRVEAIVRATDWPTRLPLRSTRWRWRAGQRVKRVMDVVLASVGLVVLSPLFLLLAILVKATSPGPVLYAFTALGHRGKAFTCYKYRTMTADAHTRREELRHLNHMSGPVFKIRKDPRVTRLGRFLRRSSLDELPQLWNVVKGEMSLVGPRPPLPEEFVEYEEWHRGRLAVIPGMTCYWQVLGRNEIHDFDTWMRLDRRYVDEWTVWLDVKLLLRTVPVVLSGHGAY